jgi:hypothetical protein
VEEKIKKAIENLTDKIDSTDLIVPSEDAVRASQAVLNLSNSLLVLKELNRP